MTTFQKIFIKLYMFFIALLAIVFIVSSESAYIQLENIETVFPLSEFSTVSEDVIKSQQNNFFSLFSNASDKTSATEVIENQKTTLGKNELKNQPRGVLYEVDFNESRDFIIDFENYIKDYMKAHSKTSISFWALNIDNLKIAYLYYEPATDSYLVHVANKNTDKVILSFEVVVKTESPFSAFTKN